MAARISRRSSRRRGSMLGRGSDLPQARSNATRRAPAITPRRATSSVRPDRADILERHGDAVARRWPDDGRVHLVAAVFEGDAVTGAVAADQVTLVEELAGLGVERELEIGAEVVVEDRRAGVDVELARARAERGDGGVVVGREVGEAQILVGTLAGADQVRGEAGL